MPPGPPAVPLLGNLLWLRHSAADVEPLLLRLFRRYGPAVTLRIGSRLSIFVADRRLAHAALVGAGASLADRPRAAASSLLGVTDNIITRADYGAVWRLLRRNLVSETLHPSRVRLFAPARAWVRRVLVDKLREAAGDGDDAPGPKSKRWGQSLRAENVRVGSPTPSAWVPNNGEISLDQIFTWASCLWKRSGFQASP